LYNFLISVVSQCIPVVELDWLDPCKATQDIACYICNRHPMIALKLQEQIILYFKYSHGVVLTHVK